MLWSSVFNRMFVLSIFDFSDSISIIFSPVPYQSTRKVTPNRRSSARKPHAKDDRRHDGCDALRCRRRISYLAGSFCASIIYIKP